MSRTLGARLQRNRAGSTGRAASHRVRSRKNTRRPRRRSGPKKGRGTTMRIERRNTTQGQSPYAAIDFRLTTSEIRNPDGSVDFRLENVEVPEFGSQVGSDGLAPDDVRRTGM